MAHKPDETAPMVWNPRARGGSGGWVTSRPHGEEPERGHPPTVLWQASAETVRQPSVQPSTLALPPGPSADSPGGARKGLFLATAAVAVVAAGAVGAVVALSLTGDSPSGTAPSVTASAKEAPAPSASSASAQAAAVDELLDESATDRQQVIDAVSAVETCGAEAADAHTTLSKAASRRGSLISRLDRLDVGRIDGGRSAVADLRSAWRYSAEADRAFADWAAAARGCLPGTVPRTEDFAHGEENSGLATAAKRDFVSKWNDIATRYGLPSRTADGL